MAACRTIKTALFIDVHIDLIHLVLNSQAFNVAIQLIVKPLFLSLWPFLPQIVSVIFLFPSPLVHLLWLLLEADVRVLSSSLASDPQLELRSLSIVLTRTHSLAILL